MLANQVILSPVLPSKGYLGKEINFAILDVSQMYNSRIFPPNPLLVTCKFYFGVWAKETNLPREFCRFYTVQ